MPTSRRTVLQGFVALGTVLAVPAQAVAARCPSDASTKAAYSFLAEKIDQYGSGLRVPQSYTGGFFAGINFVSSFLYDDALTIIALILFAARRRPRTRRCRVRARWHRAQSPPRRAAARAGSGG